MTDRELMNESLSVLLQAVPSGWSTDSTNRFYGVIEALRTRLTQPEPEPVAWMHWITVEGERFPQLTLVPRTDNDVPLYTAPPQREWQGLTEAEHTQIAIDCGCASADWVFYSATIERKLREKNL